MTTSATLQTTHLPDWSCAPYALYDMHLHLDLCDNPTRMVTDAQRLHLAFFAVPVTPQSSQRFTTQMQAANKTCASNVRIGIGAHPWWIADGSISQSDIDTACLLIAKHRFIGEIGLDFSPKHVDLTSKDKQIAAFTQLCHAAARASQANKQSRVLSIHAVQSAPEVLAILKQTGALSSCSCIFHWYSGPSDTLHTAVTNGCLFSINPMMLATKRGREYARQIPVKQLLTETDLPAPHHTNLTAQEIADTLTQTIRHIARIRNMEALALQAQLAHNAANVFASAVGGE
ncbi:MAG: TatD family hydrolase [Atopobium sp.]|uniref:TatD family hydrolase n=1 Tax=Atopobium sp. TaxID=1872650 RepID=UPI002A812F95|nr:TatD family hydrolase [Atopobium sp.]MDY4523135.1 TatD family hydrolase [Atopobium sp.]